MKEIRIQSSGGLIVARYGQVLGQKLVQYHIMLHKPHSDWPGIESVPSRSDACN
jgi:hypothetical protein